MAAQPLTADPARPDDVGVPAESACGVRQRELGETVGGHMVLGALGLPVLLGLTHGVADGSAGWLLGMLGTARAGPEVAGYLLLYNLLAFVAQPVWGWLADQRGAWKLAAVGGTLLHVSGVWVGAAAPWAAVGLAGLGSGMFHAGAGAMALRAGSGRASGVGIFAAPGVLGLGIGGVLAAQGVPAGGGFAVLLIFLGLAQTVWISRPRGTADAGAWTESGPRSAGHAGIELHDVLMIVLLSAIALRSLVWTALSWVVEGETGLVLALAASACVGKLAGGFLADRLGWRNWTILALAGSAALACWGVRQPAVACLAAALLQSATPAAVSVLWGYLPGRPGLASGLAFGLAIAAGGAPFLLGAGPPLLNTTLLAWILVLAGLGSALSMPARAQGVAHRSRNTQWEFSRKTHRIEDSSQSHLPSDGGGAGCDGH